MTTPEPDREAFEALLKRSGLTVSQAQKADLLQGYAYVVAMAARVRGETRRPREAEPAHMFKADG
jgi:hypothetical protein